MMQIEGTYRKTGIKDPMGVDVLDGSLLRYRHPSAKYRKSNKVFHVKLDQRLIDLIGGNPDKVTKYLADNCTYTVMSARQRHNLSSMSSAVSLI